MKDNMFEGSQYPQFDMVLLLTGMDMARQKYYFFYQLLIASAIDHDICFQQTIFEKIPKLFAQILGVDEVDLQGWHHKSKERKIKTWAGNNNDSKMIINFKF